MGHSSPRAALIYQHATRDRDEAIAEAMGEMFATARRKGTAKDRAGTEAGESFLMITGQLGDTGIDLGFLGAAGEGNRTLMTSLEGCD